MSYKKLCPIVLSITTILISSCGGRQDGGENIDTRPLEESKAVPIIEEILAERGYSWVRDTDVQLSNGTGFKCDYQIKGETIAIEYLTAEDRRLMGPIPPAAEGSRLHVISGRAASTTAGQPAQSLFVFIIDARKFIYHVNPTSEVRADVTFLEIDSRLRRDLADFLSWHEDSKGVR
jgi:hypothetical protein